MQVNQENGYKPLIVAFCCNWCSYAGADLAGNNRLNYPADVKIIRVPCSCRVNPMFILRAFQRGADGVILCGCHPGDCHYTSGNYYTRRRNLFAFERIFNRRFYLVKPDFITQYFKIVINLGFAAVRLAKVLVL